MNNEIKVSLSVVLPGRTMLSQEEAETLEKQGSVAFDEFNVEVSDAKGENKEVIGVKTRKSIPANQALNISKEGYDAMIDKDNCPYWSKAGTWASMNTKMRLEAHLQRICASLGGISYTYTVFED